MHPRSSLTEEQRGAAVALFERGFGYRSAASQLGVSLWPVRSLFRRWNVRGRGALVGKPTKAKYSFEFKLDVVRRVVDGGAVAEQLAQEFGLSSGELVRSWVHTYRRHGEEGLRPKPNGRLAQVPNPPTPPTTGEITDLQRLQQENLRLRAENAYLKKLRALRAQGRQ